MSESNKRFELPSDYQEVLVIHEIELSKGLSTDIIRKMVYLYTIGMEYYNIIKKPSLEKFYNDKLIGLLTRSDVLAFLDKNPININDHSNLNLFNQPNKENVYGVLIDKNNKTNINNNNNNIFSDYSTNLNNGVLSFLYFHLGRVGFCSP